ncbi:MAG: DUF4111 domain-containing protein [Anaerolineae bacterium]|nr:DUF4111 domain-containing protein [Anaerolineae bacterium]
MNATPTPYPEVNRILYTLHHAAVVSKRAAAAWAQTALEPRWRPLIQRAQAHRLDWAGPADPDALAETLAFIQWVVGGEGSTNP